MEEGQREAAETSDTGTGLPAKLVPVQGVPWWGGGSNPGGSVRPFTILPSHAALQQGQCNGYYAFVYVCVYYKKLYVFNYMSVYAYVVCVCVCVCMYKMYVYMHECIHVCDIFHHLSHLHLWLFLSPFSEALLSTCSKCYLWLSPL